MVPKVQHQQAMELSFKAKQALSELNYGESLKLYTEAARLESEVAEFYFDKIELEPTRSILIRSAAFMNLKAGLIEEAQKFIFFGLLNVSDELVKSQLNDALELSVSLKNMAPVNAATEFNYLQVLRQRSVHYVLEPADIRYGHSVSLEMIKEFTESYLKSLKAFGVAKLRKIVGAVNSAQEEIEESFANLVNPLVSQTQYGSFKFSIANDFVQRQGEKKEIQKLKANIVNEYHSEIFTNPLSDSDIVELKESFNETEMNEIFRPLTKIKANNAPFKVAYYDTESYNKVLASKIVNKQKKQIITPKVVTVEDIGELQSYLVHKTSSSTGSTIKKTLFTENFKKYESDVLIKDIKAENQSPIILSEELVVSMNFSSDIGFTITFDDLTLSVTDTTFDKALQGFQNEFYNLIVSLTHTEEKDEKQTKEFEVIKKLINNPDAIK